MDEVKECSKECSLGTGTKTEYPSVNLEFLKALSMKEDTFLFCGDMHTQQSATEAILNRRNRGSYMRYEKGKKRARTADEDRDDTEYSKCLSFLQYIAGHGEPDHGSLPNKRLHNKR